MKTHARKLEVQGRLQVIEITGAWGAYAGERIMIGTGDRGAAEAVKDGRSTSEHFELASVRVTIELVDPSPAL